MYGLWSGYINFLFFLYYCLFFNAFCGNSIIFTTLKFYIFNSIMVIIKEEELKYAFVERTFSYGKPKIFKRA